MLKSKFYEKYADIVNDFVAGFISGTLGVVVSQPFDTIKVRVQTIPGIAGGGITASECFWKTVNLEGPLALYKGMAAPLVMASALSAVTFTSYGSALRVLSQGQEETAGFIELYLAGMWGGFAQSFFATPTELLKCKLQVQGDMFQSTSISKYTGNLDLARQILRHQGLWGLFQGLMPTIYRDVPSYGWYFASYGYLKDFLPQIGFNEFIAQMVGGGLAGSSAWLLVYPIDTVKTKIQIHTKLGLQKGPLSVFVSIYQDGGVRALYRGVGTTIIRAFPTNAVVLPTYEYILQILK